MAINSIQSEQLVPHFRKFSEFILKNQKYMSPKKFSQQFGFIKQDFLAAKQRELFCEEADKFAIKLLTEKNGDFAGIIYSALVKLTELFPNELENYAKKGLDVARKNNDCVHMMARLNDLRKIYINKPDRLYDYVQTLYAQEKCLKKLSGSGYEAAAENYKSVTRSAAKKEDYKNMLAHIQTEIGKLTWRKHPEDAKRKLLNAKLIFTDKGDSKSIEYINLLLSKIENLPKLDKCG